MKKPTLTTRQFLDAVGYANLEDFHHQCHVASLKLVQSEVLGVDCRVARGTTPGVGSQHSWVVVGKDCYDQTAWVVDPTLWSYVPEVKGVWIGKANERPHKPHGSGSIWEWGRPQHMGGETIELAADPGRDGRLFLELVGPLDYQGWSQLLHAPVEGWPAKEIIEAALDTPKLSQVVPIDIVGMITDRNPAGLYV